MLTGAAGEPYVAYKVSCLGLVAALPRSGSTGVDLLVSNLDGSKTVAIQVKTTDWAERSRGRGDMKAPHELQFPLGHSSTQLNSPNLLFAFVDLRGIEWTTEQPKVYLVPSKYVADYCRPHLEGWKMPRFHVRIEQLKQFEDNWNLLSEMLM